MAEMLEECSRWVNKYHCRILLAIAGLMFPSVGAGIGWYVSASDELNRITLQTESRSISTDQALDALTAETRTNNDEIMATLNQIEVSIAILSTKLEERTAMVADQ